MDLKWPRVARRSNVGLVKHFCIFVDIFFMNDIFAFSLTFIFVCFTPISRRSLQTCHSVITAAQSMSLLHHLKTTPVPFTRLGFAWCLWRLKSHFVLCTQSGLNRKTKVLSFGSCKAQTKMSFVVDTTSPCCFVLVCWVLLFNNRLHNVSSTFWGRDKMAAVSQTTFSSALYWMKMYEFLLRFQWNLFFIVELTIFQHWFR